MARSGFTLLEVLIVVTMLGVISGVATLAIRRPAPLDARDPRFILTSTRRAALRDGVVHTDSMVLDDETILIAAYPDGQIITDPVLSRERLSGVPTNAR